MIFNCRYCHFSYHILLKLTLYEKFNYKHCHFSHDMFVNHINIVTEINCKHCDFSHNINTH